MLANLVTRLREKQKKEKNVKDVKFRSEIKIHELNFLEYLVPSQPLKHLTFFDRVIFV